MPTFVTHAAAGAAIAQVLAPCSLRGEITWMAAACAMLPDADVLGFRMGVAYGDVWGHRGFTHSLLFAGLLAVAVTSLLRNRAHGSDLVRVFACVLIATASHGILDAFTNGGLGVAFWSPFNPARSFFSVRPIMVSPLDASAFLTLRGVSVLLSEMVWIWAPSAGVFLIARFARCRGRA
jgi:inner membrane protein